MFWSLLKKMQDSFYISYGKRIFDICFSILGFLILSPFLIVVYLIISLTEGVPAFFVQMRVGKNFKLFKLIKFRTMIKEADKKGPVLTNDLDGRITKVGKILRKYKIDELPQLLNVLMGDMSIVGPRPEVPKYVEIFKTDYREILKIKPGLTDYASIAFRNEEELLNRHDNIQDGYTQHILPEKIKLYHKYLNDQSFSTDLKIIFRTIWEIFK